jgi:tetratricopeptide (TPR) repeat protein
MLETVRQYAAEKLQASGETEPVRARYRDWFVTLAEQARRQLHGTEHGIWLGRLETEHDNLRAALAWCAEEAAGAEAGLRLAGSLYRFWLVRGHWSAGRSHLRRALDREGAQGRTEARAWALYGAGALAYVQGEYAQAREMYQESLVLYRELGDRQGIALSLNGLGLLAPGRGNYGAARALLEGSLATFRELEDRLGIAGSLEGMAAILLGRAEAERAVRLWGAALALRECIGSPLPPNAREKYDRQIALARTSLGEDAFGAVWEEGHALNWRQAVAYALE